MQQNNPNRFSEKELDKLLNRSFLELDLNNPKNERMMEAVASQTFGSKTNTSQQSLIKKLIGKISLQILILSSIVILIGSIGTAVMQSNSSESKKTNTILPETHLETAAAPGNKAEASQEQSTYQKTSVTSNNMYKKSPGQSNTNSWETYHDSTTDNMTVQQPEPIHFNDPPLLLTTGSDSTSINPKHIKKNDNANDKKIKRKLKSKWREHEVK